MPVFMGPQFMAGAAAGPVMFLVPPGAFAQAGGAMPVFMPAMAPTFQQRPTTQQAVTLPPPVPPHEAAAAQAAAREALPEALDRAIQQPTPLPAPPEGAQPGRRTFKGVTKHK